MDKKKDTKDPKKQPRIKAVLLMLRNGFYFLSAKQKEPLFCELPPTIYVNLEILDERAFDKQVRNFFLTNNIVHASVIILAHAQTCYVAELNHLSPDEQEEQKEQFLDSVPHEYMYSKAYRQARGIRVVAMNKEPVRIIMEALEAVDCNVDAIVPLGALEKGEKIFDTTPTAANTQAIITRAESLRNLSVVAPEAGGIWSIEIGAGSKEEEKAKEKKNNAILLAGVFGGLLIILGVMVAFNYNSLFPKKQPAQAAGALEPSLPPATPTPTPTPPNVSALKVQLKHGGVAKDAKFISFQDNLVQIGLERKNIAVVQDTAAGSGPILIVLKDSLPEAVRTYLAQSLIKIATGGAMQQGPLDTFDVSITYR